jgi:hypothetical protein
MDLHSREIFISRNVQFYEDIFPYYSSIPTPTNHASIPHLTTSIFPDPDIPIHNPHITHLILPPHLSIFPHLFILHLPIYSTPQPAPLRKYTRPRIFPACYDDYVCPIIANTTPYLLHSFVTYTKLSSSYKSYVFSIFTHTEPSTYTQACSSLISLGYKQSQSGHSYVHQHSRTWIFINAGKKKEMHLHMIL